MLVINNYDFNYESKMLFLPDILSPKKANLYFTQYLNSFCKNHTLTKIEVIRYKANKRCLIEFTFEGQDSITLVGKVRAKGTDFKIYDLQKQLWQNGFDDHSIDKISIPEPMGIIPEWQMWLQKKVSGHIFREIISPTMDKKILKKVPRVAHKLHMANLPTFRTHLITDEVAILYEKLPLILQQFPQWENRIKGILKKCEYLINFVEEEKDLCGIHRDFYFDQIIVNQDHFYLLDLDLYCLGNLALDMGNFIGHITEYSLRKYGDFTYLKSVEKSLENEFIALVGERKRDDVKVYTILTLVRHIYLSTQFPDRHFSTAFLFDYCESLLARWR